VGADDTLAVLDDAATRERVHSAQANRNALANRLLGVDKQLQLLKQQVPLRIAQAEAALAQADAQVERARASVTQAESDARRYAELLRKGMVTEQLAESSRLKADAERRGLQAAQAARIQAQRLHDLTLLGDHEIEVREAERAALASQLSQAEAQLRERQSEVDEFRIKSPIAGTVLTRNIELGEHVSPGQTLFTLVDLGRLYLKVYVPEMDIGKIALGNEARIYVDAFPGRAFPARVSKVSQQAEFTPKNVETKKERVKLVFAVELSLAENPGGQLKPGMPADAVIRWKKEAPWAKP
jgi:HlyD family secretion protein